MKIVFDTCALLWWSLDPKEFSATASVAIEKMEQEKNGITPSISDILLYDYSPPL